MIQLVKSIFRYHSVDVALVLALLSLSTFFASVPGLNPYQKDWQRGSLHEVHFSAAVMAACGRGFVQPAHDLDQSIRDTLPELADFLAAARDNLPCSHLPTNIDTQPPTGQQILHHHLHRVIAFYWSVFGVSWSGLQPLFGCFFGLTVALSYCIFRLGMNSAMALVATLVFLPLHLIHLSTFRDYAKAPFFFLTILVLGLLLKKPPTRSGYLFVALVVGAITGIGIGFRPDLLVTIPPTLLTLLFFVPIEGSAKIRTKALALALYMATVLIFCSPVFLHESEYHNSAHVTLQGLANRFTEELGVKGSFYEWCHIYSDSWPDFQIRSYRLFNQKKLDAPIYISRKYNQSGMALLGEILVSFPSDFLTRFYASMFAIIHVPIVWFFAFLVLSTHNARVALFLILFVVYFGGYAAMQFTERHYFQLKIIPLWLTGLVLQYGLRWLVRFLKEIRCGSVAAVTLRHISRFKIWLFSSMRRCVLVTAALLMIFLLPLHLLRWYQHHQVGDILKIHFEAAVTDVEFTVTPIESNHVRLEGVEFRHLVALPRYWGNHLQAGYLVVKFSGTRCSGTELPIVFRYESGPSHDFSRETLVELGNTGGVKVMTPIYSRLLSTLGNSEFVGVEMPREAARCVEGMYLVKDLEELPPLLHIVYSRDWRDHRRYQVLDKRDGWREYMRIINTSIHRWGVIRKNVMQSWALKIPTNQEITAGPY